MPDNSFPITLSDILSAHEEIAPVIHRTPIFTSQGINKMVNSNVFFKCENLQHVGAFKMRGTSYTISTLNDEQLSNGVCTHSSGNHAQAVAKCAQMYGIPAHIVMPRNAPAVKRQAVQGYGATIYDCSAHIEDREKTLAIVQDQTGAHFIHPYNDYRVITGQATAAKELLEEAPNLNIIVAPVGGGGLLSGTGLITSFVSPTTKVYGAEPKMVDDAFRSFHSGKLEKNTTIDTIADGLLTLLGDKTLPIIRSTAQDILTVSEASIILAMRMIWERMKLIVEPSAAVPLAAVITHPQVFKEQTVGIILSGGNVDLSKLPF
ncbi:MAG: pyridoxal-phosphate dependent enzyme [Saprospiraceae bacterium]|nr:pyridoxal-phosphate dependent enzyme [Saprospiraceae bacterium]